MAFSSVDMAFQLFQLTVVCSSWIPDKDAAAAATGTDGLRRRTCLRGTLRKSGWRRCCWGTGSRSRSWPPDRATRATQDWNSGLWPVRADISTWEEKYVHLQGWIKITFPGCVNMRWNNCVFLPATGADNKIVSPPTPVSLKLDMSQGILIVIV